MFTFKDSMAVKGIIINNGNKECIHLENYEAYEYVSNTAIGSVGYKILNTKNSETANSLLLTCKLNPTLASKLDRE